MDGHTRQSSNQLAIGYVSPGWPINHFPNGVVSYVHNLIKGLNIGHAQPYVFAHDVVDDKHENQIINLSDFPTSRSILQKALTKAYSFYPTYIKNEKHYQTNLNSKAQSLNVAISQLNRPLDVLELEESFGLAYFFKKKSKIPLVVRLHGPHFITGKIREVEHEWDYNLRVKYEGKAIEIADGITSPSQDVLDKVRDYYKLSLENAEVIPNPVLPVPEHLQWKLNDNERPNILFVGRFDLIKGGDLILNAFRIVASINKDIVLNFVGPDIGINISGLHVNFEEYMGRVIPESCIKARVNFLGYCDTKTIATLRSKSTITVFSSRYETFGISLLEALSAGCPSIATAVGGVKEIVVDGFNGCLVDTHSDAIADSILRLLDNEMEMKIYAKNAIDDCSSRFSPQVIANKTMDYYQSRITASIKF